MRHRFRLAFGIGALSCLGACRPSEDWPPSYSWDPGKQQICPFPFTPKLDGDLGDIEWDEKNLWQSVDHTMGKEPATSDADASFAFACVADSKYMYFGFRIWDDVINTARWSECNAYDRDSIELYVDEHYRPADTEYNGDDSQIIIGADNGCVSESPQIGGCIEKAIPGSKTRTWVCSQRTDDGWQAEVRIPLKLSVPDSTSEVGWNIVPQHELIIGFQVGYNDVDNSSIREHKLVWGIDDRNTDESYQNSSLLEKLLFYAVNTDGD